MFREVSTWESVQQRHGYWEEAIRIKLRSYQQNKKSFSLICYMEQTGKNGM